MINDIHYLRQEIKVLTNFNDRLGKELSVCQLQVKILSFHKILHFMLNN